MKTLALSLALLAVAAAGPALGDELQMATSEMNNADAASQAGAEDLYVHADRVEANMAEKKQLRAVQRHQEALTGGQQLQFEIQVGTSDLQNAENVRSGN
jgi:cold shock CspA family protein